MRVRFSVIRQIMYTDLCYQVTSLVIALGSVLPLRRQQLERLYLSIYQQKGFVSPPFCDVLSSCKVGHPVMDVELSV